MWYSNTEVILVRIGTRYHTVSVAVKIGEEYGLITTHLLLYLFFSTNQRRIIPLTGLLLMLQVYNEFFFPARPPGVIFFLFLFGKAFGFPFFNTFFLATVIDFSFLQIDPCLVLLLLCTGDVFCFGHSEPSFGYSWDLVSNSTFVSKGLKATEAFFSVRSHNLVR